MIADHRHSVGNYRALPGVIFVGFKTSINCLRKTERRRQRSVNRKKSKLSSEIESMVSNRRRSVKSNQALSEVVFEGFKNSINCLQKTERRQRSAYCKISALGSDVENIVINRRRSIEDNRALSGVVFVGLKISISCLRKFERRRQRSVYCNSVKNPHSTTMLQSS